MGFAHNLVCSIGADPRITQEQIDLLTCAKREADVSLVFDTAGKPVAFKVCMLRVTAVNPNPLQPAVFQNTVAWESRFAGPCLWSFSPSIPDNLSGVAPQDRTFVLVLFRRWIAGGMVEQMTNFLAPYTVEFPEEKYLAMIEASPKEKTAGLIQVINEQMQKKRAQQHQSIRTILGDRDVSFFGAPEPSSKTELVCAPLLTVEGAQSLLAYVREIRQMALATTARVAVPTLTQHGGALPVSFHVAHTTVLPGTPKGSYPDRKRRVCFEDETPVPPTPQAAAPPAVAPPVPAKAGKERSSCEGKGKRLTFEEEEPQVPATPQPTPPPTVAPPAPIKEGKRLSYEDAEEVEPKPKRARKEKAPVQIPVFEKMQLRKRTPKK
jgi:hypothetical protein